MYKQLEQKYNEKKEELLKLAKRKVVNHCEYVAEECVNETFTRLCDYISRGGEVKEEGDSLIYKTLFNCIHDANECEHSRGMTGRKNKRGSFREINVINKDVSELYNIEDLGEELVKKVALKLEYDNWETFRTLMRNVLTLYYKQGYNHRQIAWFCNIGEKTSRNIISLHLKEIVDA